VNEKIQGNERQTTFQKEKERKKLGTIKEVMIKQVKSHGETERWYREK
jgi:hypothetical protein